MKNLSLRVLVLLAAIQQFVIPFFVNPFRDGANPVRATVPSQLEPAGYAFSIWGPIYLLSIAYAVWQVTPFMRNDGVTRTIAPLAIIAYLGSSVWLSLAQFGPLWATIPILACMAACANLALVVASRETNGSRPSWLVWLPFGLYAAWTLCASFVNLAEVAPVYGFDRFGLSVPNFACLSLVALTALAGLMIFLTRANIAFAATMLWALVAIIIAGAQRGADEVVTRTAFAAAIIVVTANLSVRMFRKLAIATSTSDSIQASGHIPVMTASRHDVFPRN